MSVLFMLLLFWGLLHVPPLSRISFLRTSRNKAAAAMGLTFLYVGTTHLTTPQIYEPMMPPYLPFPRRLIFISGVFEILGGIGIILPRTRRLSGLCLALLLICVLPANVHVAMNKIHLPGTPEHPWYNWARLALQPIFVLWALWSTRRTWD